MKKTFSGNKHGMTLVEIITATVALTIVLLAAGTVYISAIREFKRISYEARVQAEAYRVLDHIYLHLMGANAIQSLSSSTGSTTVFDSIEANYTDDSNNAKVLKYIVDTDNTAQVRYYPDYKDSSSSYEIIASNVTGPGIGSDIMKFTLSFTRPLNDANNNPINNYVVVTVKAVKGNMTRTYATGVVLRGMNPS